MLSRGYFSTQFVLLPSLWQHSLCQKLSVLPLHCAPIGGGINTARRREGFIASEGQGIFNSGVNPALDAQRGLCLNDRSVFMGDVGRREAQSVIWACSSAR